MATDKLLNEVAFEHNLTPAQKEELLRGVVEALLAICEYSLYESPSYEGGFYLGYAGPPEKSFENRIQDLLDRTSREVTEALLTYLRRYYHEGETSEPFELAGKKTAIIRKKVLAILIKEEEDKLRKLLGTLDIPNRNLKGVPRKKLVELYLHLRPQRHPQPRTDDIYPESGMVVCSRCGSWYWSEDGCACLDEEEWDPHMDAMFNQGMYEQPQATSVMAHCRSCNWSDIDWYYDYDPAEQSRIIGSLEDGHHTDCPDCKGRLEISIS